jgi:hypothetical protein
MHLLAPMIAVAATTCWALTASAAQVCTATSSTVRPRVIELYTSEGCSSCPPADDWLRGLPDGDAMVLLAFHVDYWDSLGWRDPFSDPRYSARQRWRASVQTQRSVYTPDIVIEGQHRQRSRELPALPPAPFALSARAQLDAQVKVQWQWPAELDASRLRAYLAITQNSASSQPNRGENRGATLRHAHVVRAYSDPVPLLSGRAQLLWPVGLQRSDARLQLVVEDSHNATPVHALRFDLQDCVSVQ